MTVSADRAELGFYEGALLPDPDGVLTGAHPELLLRHVRIGGGETAPKRTLTRLIQAAAVRMKGYRPPRHG